jgi:hypothetical protein
VNEVARQRRVITIALAVTCLLWLLARGAPDDPVRADAAVNQTIPTMTPTGGAGPTARPSVVPTGASPESPPTRAPAGTPSSTLTPSATPAQSPAGSPSPQPSSTEGPLGPAVPTPIAGATAQPEDTVAPSSTLAATTTMAPGSEQITTTPGLTRAETAGGVTRDPLRQTPAAALIETGAGEQLTLQRAALPLSCAWVGVGVALLAAGVALLVGSRRSNA